MKKKYFKLLDKIKREHAEDMAVQSKPNDRVLIIDGLNTYIRGFSVNPTCNDDGIHIGGIVAFLNSIGYAIRLLKPSRCIIVFDGKGGSYRRRKLYPDYKGKRRPTKRLNRTLDLNDSEEQRSMMLQLKRLLDYIKTLPISYIMIDNIEADDVMAYAAKKVLYNKARKIFIMSTDKDFLQLIDDKIAIWSPSKKKLYDTSDSIKEDYGIPISNYLLFKTITGDSSDNIDGVGGVKMKTLLKCFPILFIDGKSVTIDELIRYAEGHLKDKKVPKAYKIISESKDILERNYDLMRLDEINISTPAKLNIKHIINKQISRLDKINFQRMVIMDKLYAGIPNANFWLSNTFTVLDANASLSETESEL